MGILVVTADCVVCREERQFKYLDCDACFARWTAAGEPGLLWSPDICEHLECLTCGEPFM